MNGEENKFIQVGNVVVELESVFAFALDVDKSYISRGEKSLFAGTIYSSIVIPFKAATREEIERIQWLLLIQKKKK